MAIMDPSIMDKNQSNRIGESSPSTIRTTLSTRLRSRRRHREGCEGSSLGYYGDCSSANAEDFAAVTFSPEQPSIHYVPKPTNSQIIKMFYDDTEIGKFRQEAIQAMNFPDLWSADEDCDDSISSSSTSHRREPRHRDRRSDFEAGSSHSRRKGLSIEESSPSPPLRPRRKGTLFVKTVSRNRLSIGNDDDDDDDEEMGDTTTNPRRKSAPQKGAAGEAVAAIEDLVVANEQHPLAATAARTLLLSRSKGIASCPHDLGRSSNHRHHRHSRSPRRRTGNSKSPRRGTGSNSKSPRRNRPGGRTASKSPRRTASKSPRRTTSPRRGNLPRSASARRPERSQGVLFGGSEGSLPEVPL